MDGLNRLLRSHGSRHLVAIADLRMKLSTTLLRILMCTTLVLCLFLTWHYANWQAHVHVARSHCARDLTFTEFEQSFFSPFISTQPVRAIIAAASNFFGMIPSAACACVGVDSRF